MRGAFAVTTALLSALALLCAAPAQATTRTYYIAADEVVWNYAPGGQDQIGGGPVPSLPPGTLGWRFRKIIYRAYTDASFTRRVPVPATDAYQGLLGPTMHAVVGDNIVVRFKNNSPLPTAIAIAGLASSSSAVAPGRQRTYVWHISASSGPGVNDVSSIAWRYYSPVDENQDENTGMIGALIVTRAGSARPDGTPSDVDREVPILFAQMLEGESRLIGANIADPALNPTHVGSDAANSGLANAFYTIDGYSYGTMPMVTVREGERTRWYVIVTRSGFDAHAPHWHGQTLLENGMRTDAFQAEVDEITVADMIPDNPGVWLLHCHVQSHLMAGMEARYRVVP